MRSFAQFLTEAIRGLTFRQRDALQLVVWQAPDGQTYETGHPCTVPIFRNPSRNSRGQSGAHDPYAQNIEPSGRYSSYNSDPTLTAPRPGAWKVETIHFTSPLVLAYGSTAPGGWKTRLSEAFGGKTRERLSQAMVAAGYDGVITIDTDDNQPSEIVQLGWRTGSSPRILPEASAPTETDVVRAYCSSSHPINGALRGVLPMTPIVRQQVATLDRLTNDDTTAIGGGLLYRALPSSVVASLQVGESYDDPAFVSVARSQFTARKFLHPKRTPKEIVALRAPATMPGIDVSDYVGGEGFDNDDEYVLPRGTRWTYRGRDTRTGLRLFDVREGR